MPQIWIDPEAVRVEQTLSAFGPKVFVGLSRFNCPFTVTSTADQNRSILWIVFDYPGSEPEASKSDRYPDVEIRTGKHSGKIMRIALSVKDPQQSDDVQNKLFHALGEYTKANPDRLGVKLNHDAIKKVLDRNFEQLWTPFSPQ